MNLMLGSDDPLGATRAERSASDQAREGSNALPPRSVVRQRDVALSLLLFALALAYLRWSQAADAPSAFLVLAASIAAPHVFEASHGLFLTIRQRSSGAAARFARKMIALCAIYGLIAGAYFVFPAFHDTYALPLVELLGRFWPALLVGAPIYVWLTDSIMADPQDGLYQVGLAITKPAATIDWPALRQYLLAWLVKAFFLPLMIGFAEDDVRWALAVNLTDELSKSGGYYDLLYRLLYFIDVMISSVGYMMTLRLFNAQIRSSDSTALGWLVCLACYPPFWDTTYDKFLRYADNYYWDDWLGKTTAVGIVWGALILLATVIYLWGTLSFGMRFSNLTNRGIITNGAYRWMKHPSYVAKNISWWMISVPFIVDTNPAAAVRKCAALLGINVIYYLRAKTEERHLSNDPDYVAYSNWMKTNSLYARGLRVLRHLADTGLARK
jgi:protein-S-isoprenylcysteine O-methyltransferase Ste14